MYCLVTEAKGREQLAAVPDQELNPRPLGRKSDAPPHIGRYNNSCGLTAVPEDLFTF